MHTKAPTINITCTIYINSNGEKEYKIDLPKVDERIATYVEFFSTTLLDSNNISSMVDHGVGDFSFNFAKEISGDYWVQILSEKNLDYEVVTKTKDSFRIKFPEDPTMAIKIIVQ